MKPISKEAQKVFEKLVAGLEPGQAKKINKSTVFMAVSVERLTETRYSMAHYFEQNGDLVPDPDMEFWRGSDGRIYPVAIQHSTGHYQRAIEFGENGQPSSFRPRAQLDQARFAAMWLRNIKDQQNL